MPRLGEFGVCDCHSHVYGPWSAFPLSTQRTFDPPESPLDELEVVWAAAGIDQAVLVQGSAYGDDHSALLAALEQSPETRRGVALLRHSVEEARLEEFHRKGIRAIRFNFLPHLSGTGVRAQREMLADAASLTKRVAAFGWHVEVHLDAANLNLLDELVVPDGMPVVIDHMARIDLSSPRQHTQIERLCEVLESRHYWVKLSGADRLTSGCDSLGAARNTMRMLLRVAPDRCVWGLDWPHVNLALKRTDDALVALLVDAAGDEQTLRSVLVDNPARLYGFSDCAA